MSALPSIYKEARRFTTHWFRMPDGQLQSFRWLLTEAKAKRAAMPEGAVEVQDPFRQGAPLGGHATNTPISTRHEGLSA